jgi:hypothetical protein
VVASDIRPPSAAASSGSEGTTFREAVATVVVAYSTHCLLLYVPIIPLSQDPTKILSIMDCSGYMEFRTVNFQNDACCILGYAKILNLYFRELKVTNSAMIS